MILCQEVELCASLRRYYPVQVVRVRSDGVVLQHFSLSDVLP